MHFTEVKQSPPEGLQLKRPDGTEKKFFKSLVRNSVVEYELGPDPIDAEKMVAKNVTGKDG